MSLSDAIKLHRNIVSLLQSGNEELALERFNSIWPVIESHVAMPAPAAQAQPDQIVFVIPPSPTASPTPSRCSSPSVGTRIDDGEDDDDDGVRPLQLVSTNDGINMSGNSTASFTVQSILPSHTCMTALPWKEMEDINAMLAESGLDEGNCNDDQVDFNVFSRFGRVFAFYADTDTVLTLGEWLRCMLSLRVVLYYHVALAHHAMAEQRGDSHALYDLALQFYHRAQQIHFVLVHTATGNTGAGSGNECYNHQLDIVALAIYNNMGHCYAHFGNSANAMATWCFDQLLVLFCTTHQRQRHVLSADELVFFQDRIQLGMAKRQRPSSAA